MTSADLPVTRIADGVYRVVYQGRAEIVYVAGRTGDWWAFWSGEVFRATLPPASGAARSRAGADAPQSLAAPMPATVLKVLVAPGATVRKGETVVILEAMKMELPVRAPADATVKAVHCRDGELVQADAVLIELQ
jgi:3-methylcrotonyl-CoA carboxylase alpha subunit